MVCELDQICEGSGDAVDEVHVGLWLRLMLSVQCCSCYCFAVFIYMCFLRFRR